MVYRIDSLEESGRNPIIGEEYAQNWMVLMLTHSAEYRLDGALPGRNGIRPYFDDEPNDFFYVTFAFDDSRAEPVLPGLEKPERNDCRRKPVYPVIVPEE